MIITNEFLLEIVNNFQWYKMLKKYQAKKDLKDKSVNLIKLELLFGKSSNDEATN